MDDAVPPGNGMEALTALEAEVVALRSDAAQVRRDRAAVDAERAAMEHERAAWVRERDELRRPTGGGPSAPVAERTRSPPRRVLGTLAHKSALVRRLRDGRGPRPG